MCMKASESYKQDEDLWYPDSGKGERPQIGEFFSFQPAMKMAAEGLRS